jgi:hypothetical protein
MKTIEDLLEKEMARAREQFGPYHNAHELLGVLREEYLETEEAVRGNYLYKADGCYELLQVAAVALRYIREYGDPDKIALVQDCRWPGDDTDFLNDIVWRGGDNAN